MGPINNKLVQPAWRAGQSRAQTPMRSAINPHKSEVGQYCLRGILKILQSKDYLSIVNVENMLFPHHCTTGKQTLCLMQGEGSRRGALETNLGKYN